VESNYESLISLISNDGIAPKGHSMSMLWSGITALVQDIETDMAALLTGLLDSISDSREIWETSAENKKASIAAVSSVKDSVLNKALSLDALSDVEAELDARAGLSSSRFIAEPLFSKVLTSERQFLDSLDETPGGRATPTWELFADSFGVLQEDKYVLWVKPEPAGIQVLRAAQ